MYNMSVTKLNRFKYNKLVKYQKCALCGKWLSQYNTNIDHIIPVSRGGSNLIQNLQLTHVKCNLKKGSQYKKTDKMFVYKITDILSKLSKSDRSKFKNIYPKSNDSDVIEKDAYNKYRKSMGVKYHLLPEYIIPKQYIVNRTNLIDKYCDNIKVYYIIDSIKKQVNSKFGEYLISQFIDSKFKTGLLSKFNINGTSEPPILYVTQNDLKQIIEWLSVYGYNIDINMVESKKMPRLSSSIAIIRKDWILNSNKVAFTFSNRIDRRNKGFIKNLFQK